MPIRIEHIDAIARKKVRDVLYLTFCSNQRDEDGFLIFDWRTHPARLRIIEWLNANDIPWTMCAEFASSDPDTMMSYMGQIYIDIPYDSSLPEYKRVEQFLENPDGSIAFADTRFFYLPLEDAQKNAAHDGLGGVAADKTDTAN